MDGPDFVSLFLSLANKVDPSESCRPSCSLYAMPMGNSRSSWGKQTEALRAMDALRVQRNRSRNTQIRARNRERERIRLYSCRSAADPDESPQFENVRSSASRTVLWHAKRFADSFQDLTAGKGLEFQRAFLRCFLEQPLMQQSLPDYIVHRKELEQCKVVCKGLAEAWSGLKYGHSKDRYAARNVIEAAVISIGEESSLRAAAMCIGMNKRTLKRAVARRYLLNDGAQGEVWAKVDRRRRKDSLQQPIIDAVVEWWTAETRVSPNKKDVRRKQVGVRSFISHATHWLEESQVSGGFEVYCRFCYF
jgi:hypothetical protein